jgi:rhodanese-related sulfurtransferase
VLIPDIKQELLIITPVGREQEAIVRLARVGYDNVLGYLRGGFNAWVEGGKETEKIDTISVTALESRMLSSRDFTILDVRKPGEWSAKHVDGAMHFPLDFINNHMTDISRTEKYVLHCRSGYRSTIAASILKARGFDHLVNVHGTFDQIENSEIPVTDVVHESSIVEK